MVKENQVAYGVRVKLNENFKPGSLAEKYLMDEPVLYIGYDGIQNDVGGKYVWVHGGSGTNSGPVYLKDIHLEYPVPDKPLYQLYKGIIEQYPERGCSHMYYQNDNGHWLCEYCSAVKEEDI